MGSDWVTEFRARQKEDLTKFLTRLATRYEADAIILDHKYQTDTTSGNYHGGVHDRALVWLVFWDVPEGETPYCVQYPLRIWYNNHWQVSDRGITRMLTNLYKDFCWRLYAHRKDDHPEDYSPVVLTNLPATQRKCESCGVEFEDDTTEENILEFPDVNWNICGDCLE